MKPGLYTNDKGTSVVFASHVEFQGEKPTFVEYHRVKPQIYDSHWSLYAADFLERWPHRIEEIKIVEGTGPAKKVTPGLYTDGEDIAWVIDVGDVYELKRCRGNRLLLSPTDEQTATYIRVSEDDSSYTVRSGYFLESFPYRVTEIEVQD